MRIETEVSKNQVFKLQAPKRSLALTFIINFLQTDVIVYMAFTTTKYLNSSFKFYCLIFFTIKITTHEFVNGL
jgi:hypothetical protein